MLGGECTCILVITSVLANQDVPKSVLTCVVYTKMIYVTLLFVVGWCEASCCVHQQS